MVSKLLFNTKYELKRRMNILQITVILVVSTRFGDDQFMGGGGGGAGVYGRCLYVPS